MYSSKKEKQELRHSWWARLLRRGLYYCIVDRESWPISFEPPTDEDDFSSITSPNIYIHLPFCKKICYYCPYVKFPFIREKEQQYGQSLLEEIRNYINAKQIKPIKSLYFGGGTPSLSPVLVEQVINLFRPHLLNGAEVAIELHPLHCNTTFFQRLKRIGINKLSIGIESFSPEVLKVLGRHYSTEAAKRAVIAAKQEGFDCVDINLLFSIPEQTIDDVATDVYTAISLGVDHISVYPLFSFRHTALGKSSMHRPEGISAIKERVLVQKKISSICLKHGYQRTSVWSFTRPGISPYTTVTRDSYCGFGVGAGSKVGGLFWFNSFSLNHYLNTGWVEPALVMRASDRFQRFHWLYWRIYNTEINPTDYYELYGRELERDFQLLFFFMRLFGWISCQGEYWQITERGAVFAHLFQSLFSLSFIDILWMKCQSEALPRKVVLE